MKQCTKCHESRPLDNFGKSKSRSDGLQLWCKLCQKAYRQANTKRLREATRKWKQENPEKVKASRSRHRANPEVQAHRAAYNKAWKSENPGKVREQHQRNYAKNADARRSAARKYAVNNPDKVRSAGARWRAANEAHIKNYRQKNRHKDRAYYAENAESIRVKRENCRLWSVYRIDFKDGTFYIGSSGHPDLRFNAHKSLATRDLHVKSLNDKDFTGAQLNVFEEHPSEEAALIGETLAIQRAWLGTGCLNKTLPTLPKSLYWVYVIQSLQGRTGKNGKPLPGFFYVGMTTSPTRRLREHNGIYANGEPGNPNGGKYTSQHRPWEARALYGPYFSRSEALRAEYALKRGKRGEARLTWTPQDSVMCRGTGVHHEWVQESQKWRPPTPTEWREHLMSVVIPT